MKVFKGMPARGWSHAKGGRSAFGGKKFNLSILVLIVILSMAGAVNASMLIPASEKAKDHARAPEKSPVINETESGEWELERVDFIHYAKPDNPGKPPKGQKGGNTCYKTLGVKWKTLPVDYVINPTNGDGLSESFVTSTISTAAETWDAETGSELFNDYYTVDTSAQYGIQNYENAIVFGSHSDNNVIGVTSVWFTRRGKQIVEFDMKLNDYYTWGDATATATSSPVIMDLENIVVHELGHGAGLDDIYNSSCAEVTMYGYSGYGETKKRTLEPADISGIQKLYGI